MYLKMATCKTNCCHSDLQKSLFNNRKVHKKTRHVTCNIFILFCAILTCAKAQNYQNYQSQNPYLKDRDPRFYSRPGIDYLPGIDYRHTNPGDKDYR